MIPFMIEGCRSSRLRVVHAPAIMTPLSLFCLVFLIPIGPSGAYAADQALIRQWLEKDILPPGLTMRQVQAFAERQVPVLRSFSSVKEWEKYARDLRREILQEIVFRGAAEDWRKGQTRVEWLETIRGGPGYHIRKLRYEAVPGLWIPALLYEPEELSGRVPVVLNVNGHEGLGKAAPYKQLRCIHQAKRGMIALNTEWLGMGQLAGANYQHARMNQLDLCGTSGLAPYYLAMKRALDVLLKHEHADPDRVAVAGLSGGGWQTIFISALDERVTLANPVAGYSSFRTRTRHLEDLGDSEQTPSDLANLADYTHLTALLAPRPALLTYNAKDNCCFASDHALPPLLAAAEPIYDLYGQKNRLRSHVNFEPGDHNFGQDNRQALYQMLRDFFYTDPASFATEEWPSEDEIKSPEALHVALPEANADFHSLAVGLAQSLPRNGSLPTQRSHAEKWRQDNREILAERIRVRPYRAVVQPTPVITDPGGITIRLWRFQLRTDWTVPAAEICPPSPKATAIVVHDQGRRQASAQVAVLLEKQYRVIALDLFYFGESSIPQKDWLFALLVAAIGERPLGLQAAQLAAVARWTSRQYPQAPTVVQAHGPRSSLIALVAAGLDEDDIQELDLHDSLGSLREVIEQNWSVNQRPEWFCFGLLQSFDLRHLTALVAPRPVFFHRPSDRLGKEMELLPVWYALLGRDHNPISSSSTPIGDPPR